MKRNTVARIGTKVLGISLAIGALVGSAVAQPALNDSEEPGSVIVFPKFIRGLVSPSGAGTTPKTEITVSVVCPDNIVCSEGQRVKIRFHWVCPADASFVCRDNDFDVMTTVNGSAVFNTEHLSTGATVVVPLPPCNQGYLIGCVEDNSDRPIKFDGLIGNAVLRESASAILSYNGIPIQASPALATGALIPDGNLVFDGMPGHYKALTGVIFATVVFDKPPTFSSIYWYSKSTTQSSSTLLTLLTLDTLANRPNFPTFVDLNFYNSQEVLLSTGP